MIPLIGVKSLITLWMLQMDSKLSISRIGAAQEFPEGHLYKILLKISLKARIKQRNQQAKIKEGRANQQFKLSEAKKAF